MGYEDSTNWGLETPHKEANMVKHFLIKNNYLDDKFKVIRKSRTIVFPLKEPISSQIVNTLPPLCTLIKCTFIQRQNRKGSPIELMKTYLPPETYSYLPNSYDIIGDILLVKLSATILPYKTVIANIYLECLPNISTVYNKITEIASPYRVAEWECIGGSPHTLTTHKMNGIEFKIDFTKVYFNPRLNNEYQYIANAITAHEIIWDLFCGVGPFTLLCALKQPVQIYANDINPDAINLLNQNLEHYKEKLQGKVFLFTQDTREAVFQLPPPDKILMNLPEEALSFFPPVLKRLQDFKAQNIFKPVSIYLHHFGHKEQTDTTDLKKNLELMGTLDLLNNYITKAGMTEIFCKPRILRVVSPNKTHFVIDIKLDR